MGASGRPFSRHCKTPSWNFQHYANSLWHLYPCCATNVMHLLCTACILYKNVYSNLINISKILKTQSQLFPWQYFSLILLWYFPVRCQIAWHFQVVQISDYPAYILLYNSCGQHHRRQKSRLTEKQTSDKRVKNDRIQTKYSRTILTAAEYHNQHLLSIGGKIGRIKCI